MTYAFRKAVRENSSVLVALAGPTGSGKTVSAIRLARGLSPKGKIVVLDTESGRATHYADQYDFDHAEIKPPFSPQTYRDAIEAAEKAGYAVIVIDSMSHEWSGDGGCQDMQADALERLAKGDPYKLEKLTAPAWKEPKAAHKRFMSRLLQCRVHLIFGLRAEQKIRFVKIRDDNGRERTVIEDAGFQPICEKHFMFEMTCSFMIDDKHLPHPIKLPEQFKPFFPLDQPISEESGKRLAEWAAGGKPNMQGGKPNMQGGLERPQREPYKLHEAGSTPAPATNPPAESSSRLAPESPIPSPANERAALLKQIRQYADRLKPKDKKRQAEWEQDKRNVWNTNVGEGVKPEDADPAALYGVLSWLKARAGE